MWPDSVEIVFIPHPVFSSQSAGSVDLTEILLASRRATLHDFMALSYGPARGLAYDWRRGFRAWANCDDRHGKNFCLVHCNAHKRVQALPAMPRHVLLPHEPFTVKIRAILVQTKRSPKNAFGAALYTTPFDRVNGDI
jgi:hypothetical protein